MVYTISGGKQSLDLAPYLDGIYSQSEKGKDRYSENGKPFIIEQEDYKLVITYLDGKKLEDGKIKLDDYIQGYLLLK